MAALRLLEENANPDYLLQPPARPENWSDPQE
jgi:hypothetical protein